MVNQLSHELTQLIGVPVDLIEASPGKWIAAPQDRALLRAKLWRSLRAGPHSGVSTSPTGAALLLARAAGASGRRAVTKTQQATAWLKQAIGGQTLRATDVQAMAQVEGIAWATIDRAARELGVQRSKQGLEGPWCWTLR